jgi:CDP-diacylglycerol--glycerol-3-phosphate 3-phosphatidyltransferase/cardiolipin synthase
MVYQNDLLGIPIYTVGFVLLLAAAVMTSWSMFFYLKAAWPFIMADQDGEGGGEKGPDLP